MSPLKRQRTNAGDDGREQKRACSDPFPANLVGDEDVTWFQIAAAPSSQAQSVPKRCIHKIVTACNLPPATCCACLDARLDGLNFMYSLEGHVCGLSECRWQYYCFGCQEYWNIQNNLGRHHRRPLAVTEVENVPNTIRVNYGSWAVDITRSVDLTVDGLKAEVARLTQCHQSQLTMSDIALHKGGALPKMSDDNALTLCATHVKFTCATGADSEYDEMEGVQYD